MVREDHVGIFADKQPAINIYVPGLEHLYLIEEGPGVDHYTVTDHAYLMFVEYP